MKSSTSAPRLFHTPALLTLATLLLANAATARADFLVASDAQGSMKSLDLQTHAVINTIPAGKNATEVEYVPATRSVYASFFSKNELRKIDPFTGASSSISLPGAPRDVLLGRDGRLYVAVDGDGAGHGTIGIFRFDPVAGGPITQFSTGTMPGSPTGLAFAPNGDLFVTIDGRYPTGGTNSVVRIDGATGLYEGIVTSSHVSIPESIVFDNSGNFIVSNQGDKTITRFATDGSYIDTLVTSAGNPNGLTFLSNGNLAWGNGGSLFRQYDFATHQISDLASGFRIAIGLVQVPEPTSAAYFVTLLLLTTRRSRTRRPVPIPPVSLRPVPTR